MSDLRRARERHPDLPRMVLVHQGNVAEGETLLGKRFPAAIALSDPELALYHAFGLGRGRVGQLLGAGAWMAGVRALTRGHFVGKPVGDPWIMPGLFLCRGDRILWRRSFDHAGDLPSEEELVAAVRGALGERG